jgi:hypothetical protein
LCQMCKYNFYAIVVCTFLNINICVQFLMTF